jgi:hypothetical protein
MHESASSPKRTFYFALPMSAPPRAGIARAARVFGSTHLGRRVPEERRGTLIANKESGEGQTIYRFDIRVVPLIAAREAVPDCTTKPGWPARAPQL